MRKTKEDAEQTRREILDAAARAFSNKGFAKSSLEEIAREAKVTRGAIYWHFKNKAEIFDALHEQLYLPLAERVQLDLKNNNAEPLDQLRDFCINMMLSLQDDKREKQILMLFLMKQNYDGELAEYKDIHYQRKIETLKLFERYFEKARDRGKLQGNGDVELLAKSVNYFIRGIVSEFVEYPEKFNLQQIAPKLIAQFFDNLKAGQG